MQCWPSSLLKVSVKVKNQILFSVNKFVLKEKFIWIVFQEKRNYLVIYKKLKFCCTVNVCSKFFEDLCWNDQKTIRFNWGNVLQLYRSRVAQQSPLYVFWTQGGRGSTLKSNCRFFGNKTFKQNTRYFCSLCHYISIYAHMLVILPQQITGNATATFTRSLQCGIWLVHLHGIAKMVE